MTGLVLDRIKPSVQIKTNKQFIRIQQAACNNTKQIIGKIKDQHYPKEDLLDFSSDDSIEDANVVPVQDEKYYSFADDSDIVDRKKRANSEDINNIAVDKYNLDGKSSRKQDELEALSCTDVEQVWGSYSGSGSFKNNSLEYSKPVPVKFCHATKRKRNIQPTGSLNQAYEKIFKVVQVPGSALKLFVEGRSSGIATPDNITRITDFEAALFNQFISVSNDIKQLRLLSACGQSAINFYNEFVSSKQCEAGSIFKNTRLQNGENKIWMQYWQIRITGTSAYNLYTYYCGKNTSWETKLLKIMFPKFAGNHATRYGKNCPHLEFSLDGFIKENGEMHLIEIK
ncbi:unnamed protein product [Diabrotica balteata]|uniref:Uncharacterized protein n=1 Tax=Diabrotica balteata TaxID=107213 RepID=A0A9N9SUK9_DIABA|nr:unnamed protein product [Diabrotica balteata]